MKRSRAELHLVDVMPSPNYLQTINKIYMKANELRICNLINYQEDNTMFEVVGIEQGGLYVKNAETQTWIEIDQFEPIPLTEEWLIKLGFEPLPFVNLLNSYTKSIGRNRILSIGSVGTPNEMIWLCEVNAVDKKVIDDLVCIRNYDYDKYTHVHQLQNLYYALTGEELVLGEA